MKIRRSGLMVLTFWLAAISSIQSQGVSYRDLNLGFDSAVALVGPEQSPARLNRIDLQQALHRHFERKAESSIAFRAGRAARIAVKLLSGETVDGRSNVSVRFPDQTAVQVSATESLTSLAEGGGFGLDVRVATVMGPGLPVVPQSRGQFGRFSYSGNERTLDELVELARRYGIRVGPTNPDGEASATSSLVCEGTAGEIRCALRPPIAQRDTSEDS